MHNNTAGWIRTVARWSVGALLTLTLITPSRADTNSGLDDFRNGRFAEAFEAWQAAAAAGDANGALFAGVLSDTGEGVTQDYDQALTFYRRAAELGSAAGAFNVGVMYDAGRGVAPDPQQAAIWYARAAAKGFPRAEYNLALLYEAGTGVPRDRAAAIAFYTKAAAHGIPAARMHLRQLGQTFAGPVRPVEDVAMRDFHRAQQLLLARGPAEASHAAELFHSAADQHNALAEYDLGYCYEHGARRRPRPGAGLWLVSPRPHRQHRRLPAHHGHQRRAQPGRPADPGPTAPAVGAALNRTGGQRAGQPIGGVGNTTSEPGFSGPWFSATKSA